MDDNDIQKAMPNLIDLPSFIVNEEKKTPADSVRFAFNLSFG